MFRVLILCAAALAIAACATPTTYPAVGQQRNGPEDPVRT